MHIRNLALASALALASMPLHAEHHGEAAADEAVVADAGRWITLGTRAGPVPSSTRSQPANLLIAGGKNILVDVGDGSAGQLIKVGLPTNRLDAVFITHLHFDHTAGLAGILGLRLQTNAPDGLLVYGPPGTADLVDGLLASMVPGNTAGYGVAGAATRDLAGMVEVVELRDHASLQYAGMTISARNNTHYSFAPDSGLAERFESLSYRFDLPGRSIVYTGDTGPSTAVEELAQGADLLVAEMMDVDETIRLLRRDAPNMPEPVLMGMESHLRDHHLLPRDVGEMAGRAGVGAVVVTHFSGRERGDPVHFEYLRQIAENFDGPVVIANDLDTF
ncbi:Rv2407 family type 3 sulfatase [Alteraurantiacibacter aestuarii]|uniref:MBL fold metallo-hydrolase n=1 Tax=Alteraurantiacibacter aestuarii TaxID=650004 RepID=A0A844ZKT3_9SPHN|nr:MBL fold metallo-hydrolase [Alteraurantiacibacter aestuarii]MXO88174.1 MBL fold metallo-hydrolase [Alteraurantiacibacter aestuarii]